MPRVHDGKEFATCVSSWRHRLSRHRRGVAGDCCAASLVNDCMLARACECLLPDFAIMHTPNRVSLLARFIPLIKLSVRRFFKRGRDF